MRNRVRAPECSSCSCQQRWIGESSTGNLPGVSVACYNLCAEDLAPGGDMGRLTVFTTIEAMNKEA